MVAYIMLYMIWEFEDRYNNGNYAIRIWW